MTSLNSHLIIRTCRHILPDGRCCRGAAVRGRACCRHHLDARARLHNMARARRRTLRLRLRFPETRRDLAANRAEVARFIASGRCDFQAARMMLWAMDLTAATFRLGSAPLHLRRRIRSAKPNKIYHVPASPVFDNRYLVNLSEMIENTKGSGGGGTSARTSFSGNSPRQMTAAFAGE